MGFVASLIISLVLMVVGELLRPKQTPPNAKPSSLDDFDLPTAEEGRSIPVIVGKVKINGPNVTYYGDLEVEPLKKKVKTGLWSSKRVTFAHRYKMGMQMFLCFAREDLDIHEIRFGDKMPAHSRVEEGNGVVRFNFNDVNFFGGDEKEGGISGVLRFYRGRDNQPENAYFSARIGETAPAYQGCAYAMLEKMYLGTSQYLKPIGYIVSSYPNTLGVTDDKHKIGEDGNPVCFIYEILNEGVWGLNINPARIDVASFIAAAETVFDEGYGVSMIINTGSSAEDLISEVLRHIDGVIFTDPSTGLITIKLARADYDIDEIPTYGPDDFIEGIKFSRASWSQTRNTIKASFISRENDYQEAVVSQQDLSNIVQREGEIATENVDFRGFAHVDAANRACARTLKTYSYPLAKATCSVTRKGWALRPGSVFKLDWPQRGINNVVMRVVRIDYGNLKTNRIDIDATEDIFAISKSAYLPPPPSGWVDPVGNVQALRRQFATDLPFPMIGEQGATIATFGSRSGGIDEGYRVTSDRTTPYDELVDRTTVIDFTASAEIVDAIPLTSTARLVAGFEVDDIAHLGDIEPEVSEDEMLAGGAVALIVSSAGQEWIAYRELEEDGAYYVRDVLRGIYDTPPLAHPAGATIWFTSTGYGLENEGAPYLTATEVHIKLLPYNVRGVLSPVLATPIIVETDVRGSRPFPPGKIRVNGTHPLDVGAVAGTLSLAWAHRALPPRVCQRLRHTAWGAPPRTHRRLRWVAL